MLVMLGKVCIWRDYLSDPSDSPLPTEETLQSWCLQHVARVDYFTPHWETLQRGYGWWYCVWCCVLFSCLKSEQICTSVVKKLETSAFLIIHFSVKYENFWNTIYIHIYTNIYIQTYIYKHIYIYICMCELAWIVKIIFCCVIHIWYGVKTSLHSQDWHTV